MKMFIKNLLFPVLMIGMFIVSCSNEGNVVAEEGLTPAPAQRTKVANSDSFEGIIPGYKARTAQFSDVAFNCFFGSENKQNYPDPEPLNAPRILEKLTPLNPDGSYPELTFTLELLTMEEEYYIETGDINGILYESDRRASGDPNPIHGYALLIKPNRSLRVGCSTWFNLQFLDITIDEKYPSYLELTYESKIDILDHLKSTGHIQGITPEFESIFLNEFKYLFYGGYRVYYEEFLNSVLFWGVTDGFFRGGSPKKEDIAVF